MTSTGSSIAVHENLYFIAIIPPPPIDQQAWDLKEYFKHHYGSKASLNSPPHITLHMPFRWREKKEGELTEKLSQFCNGNQPVLIRFKNYGSFAPRVIFINVEQNGQLDDLQRELQRFCKKTFNLFNANYKELPFHPHLTLAFRDLKKSAFQKAWEEFRERIFQAEFTAEKIALLKHNGRHWEVSQEFQLQKIQG